MNKPTALIVGVGWVCSLVIVGWLTKSFVGGDTEQRSVPPDTVVKERKITKRDTVTETIPRTVVRYDTVETLDTIKVRIPTGINLMGLLPRQPIDITSGEATLTYFHSPSGEWRQNIYDVPQEQNRFSMFGEGIFLPTQVAVIGGVTYKRDLGWINLSMSPGYVLTEEGNGIGAKVRLSKGVSF